MLSQFRAFAKSPVAKVLLVLLGLSFVVFGARDFLGHGGGRTLPKDAVVLAGSRTLTPAQFKRVFDGYLQQVSQQQAQKGQPPVSVQDAVAANLDQRAAESMGDDLAAAEMTKRLGVLVSDRQVVGEIRKSPAFFDPVSGRFDKKSYEGRLAEAGLTTTDFEQSLRDEIGQNHMLAGMVAGLRAPRIYGAVETAYVREGRSFSWFLVPASIAGPPVKPTDAQLQQFMKEHAAQLTRPALRTLTVVRFSTAALAPTMPVDPALLQKRFDFEKDSLSTPEKRTLVQVTAKDQASAASLSAKLRAGADTAKAAAEVGGQVLPYAGVPKTAIADKRVADAAFSLKAGVVSGPIQGELGWAVVKLGAITPSHAATLDEARPKIEAEVKKDAAQERIYAQVQKFGDARSGGAGVVAAAKTVGVETQVVGPITAEGQSARPPTEGAAPPPALPPKVLAAAFKLPQGGESDVIDLTGGEYYAVRVDRVQPPAPPPLEEIRAPLTRFYVLQDLVKRVRARADVLAEAVRKGQPIDVAARSIGATPGQGAGLLRDGGGQTFSRDLLGQLFAAKTGDVVVGEDVKLGFVVAKLTAVAAPAAAEVAPGLDALRQQVTRGLYQDVSVALRAVARARIKPVVDAKRAREALGASAQPAS